MIDQQLYIDGVLMDLSEDTNITLDIKSNLFRDISKMETNNTYTIELPKTMHNMASVDWAAKPKTGSKYPYVFHKARYFRNGVEVIKDGRASLLSVEDNIEIAIYWGLFPAFSSLQESDMKLSDLQTTKYIRFEKTNKPTDYDKALQDGVFYADYDQRQVRPSSDDWDGYDITEGRNEDVTYELVNGKIKTGTAAGAHVSGSIDEDSAYKCCIVPFAAGETASINNIISKGEYRTYAILDKNMNIISLADDAGKVEVDTYPVLPAPDPVLGMFVSAGACIANIETSVAMETISIKVRAEKAGSVEYGTLDKETGETTPWGTYEISAAGEAEFSVVKSKPSGILIYIKPSVDDMINMELSTAVAAYYLSGGKLSQVKAGGAYGIKYTSESHPIDVNLQAPSTSAYLIINAIAEYSTGTTLKVKKVTESASKARSSSGSGGSFGNQSGGGTFLSAGPLQPVVSVRWLMQLIAQQTGVKFSFADDARENIESLAIPLVTRKADEKTISGGIKGNFSDTTSIGILNFELSASSDVISEKANVVCNQITIAIDCSLTFDVQMIWSWDASKATPNGYRTFNFEGSTERQAFYTYPPNYIEMKVRHRNDDGSYTENTYIAGKQKDQKGDNSGFVTDYESNKVNGRFIHLCAGRGTLDLAAGDTITFEMKNDKGRNLYGLRCYNGKLTANIKENEEVPIGGMFPIGKNLPEVKVTDFVKFLSLITATFPKQDFSDGAISFNSLALDKNRAINWSGRLIARSELNHPRGVEFSIESYCQHNIYKWKEDETVYEKHDADMMIANATLEYTQDIWTMPFAASDGNRVPIYGWEESTSYFGNSENKTAWTSLTATQYKACKDRIMRLRKTDAGKASLIFDLDLQKVFDMKMASYRKLIAGARVITEHFRLSDIEILEFDETKPVYIAQYGAYFAVLEIKTTNSGYCEVEMIELIN